MSTEIEVEALRAQCYRIFTCIRENLKQIEQSQALLRECVRLLDARIGEEATNRMLARACLKVGVIPKTLRQEDGETLVSYVPTDGEV
ncbi:hypothetical protein EI42_05421 [Thermosporothrix hazakensis]|uniref:Uncharacterized protein n=2 Tax=Thermosporothrix TaxID=768650 RepID=A0A326TYT1_THEHA|nr:hypothetical protein [Thermosporothrix hazakensis]PZW22515.1 hypothetical protein EI42_05421 [Thermosporothrix hazakensis]BBH87768.1 hypothetical protein KTC_25190 [Thermosporothrix sp. COM3]GCE50204.1 hypothetical protein KTH_50730 [Thermosporothrix hazakensis]